MKVTVQFFSFYKNLAEAECATVELAEGAKLSTLVNLLMEQYPSLASTRERAMFMIGQRMASRETVLSDGDQIIMLQTVGGG